MAKEEKRNFESLNNVSGTLDSGFNSEWPKILRWAKGPKNDHAAYRAWLIREHGETIEALKKEDYWSEVLRRRPDLRGI